MLRQCTATLQESNAYVSSSPADDLPDYCENFKKVVLLHTTFREIPGVYERRIKNDLCSIDVGRENS